MNPSAEQNRIAPKSNDLSVAPVHERRMPDTRQSIALPEFALLLQKELEKFKPEFSNEDAQEGNSTRFFDDFMMLLYGQNQMAREISESRPMDYDERHIMHSFHPQITNDAGFRAYLEGKDRRQSTLYMRYQNLYDSPAGTGFKRSF
ncbi:hypothetical protein [Rhodohalobacter mucosus]|uniref:Uncharacterized protein n=1 Tax=Rhodohalobacter mucosus TaxID=2079485 RepID=A0A316TKY2_9BACT|nr:hypothetical protein [Rhodohalobacter mucosus]PWN05213.1 hypothetical protein DDZ15_15930 [Rhodohalobacter mucosus]